MELAKASINVVTTVIVAAAITFAFLQDGPAAAAAASTVGTASPPPGASKEEGEGGAVPILLESSRGQIQFTAGTDVLGPVTWQLFVRPRSKTNRVVDRNYLSIAGRVRVDWAFDRGSLFLQPIYRLIPQADRADARDFSETELGFVQLSRINASGYGGSVGWAIGSIDPWSTWRPWIAVSIEKSVVRAEIWTSDSFESSGAPHAIDSSLLAAHAIFGLGWNPIKAFPRFGLEPTIMLPLASRSSVKHNREIDTVKRVLYDELDHRVSAGIGLSISGFLRF